jgi:flagellar P-ring protein FlgI
LKAIALFLVLLTKVFGAGGQPQLAATSTSVRVGDISSIEGVRANPLVGYGLVVGLNGTGDRRQTIFTTQMPANILQRLGISVSPGMMRVNNVAAVMVTATMPAFSRPGTQIDVTVSSMGDAKSLDGGTLLLTELRAADGEVYATSQGSLVLAGFTASAGANAKQTNHPTVGRIPSGGTVERDSSVGLQRLRPLTILLREQNFNTAQAVCDQINIEFGRRLATVVDGRRVAIEPGEVDAVPATIARIQSILVHVYTPAKVVVSERTGTIVIGKNVRIKAVSVLHGNFRISVTSEPIISQPEAFSSGETTVASKTQLRAKDEPARRLELQENATVDDLVSGLQTIGATARDIVAIMQAIKAAGALEAELEVL